MRNPLLDTEFLRALDTNRNRTVYAKIISLNQYEYPIEQIEGVVTAGSISIDGESAVRRICQLTLSAKNLNINNVYWGLTTKIKIEIGLENTINDNYDPIIWFRQGLFILTDFKTSQTINNYTINLTGKDKMCLLNGDVAGNLLQPVRFDTYTDDSNNSIEIDDSGAFNLFEKQIADSGINDDSNFIDGYYNNLNYSQQLSEITELYYIPSSADGNVPATAEISFDITSQKFQSLNDIAIFDPDLGKYLIDYKAISIYGFQVKGCNPHDIFEWYFKSKIPITTIIENILHHYGQEKIANIVVRDINPFALTMVQSSDENTYYLLYSTDATIELDECHLCTESTLLSKYRLPNGNRIDLSTFNFAMDTDEDNFNLFGQQILYDRVKDSTNTYFVIKIDPGDTAGYKMTPLIYPDNLTGNTGESITSVLDKIVKHLGNYEYFYNLDGQFIFQAKPAYIDTPWNNTVYLTDDNYVDPGEAYKRIGYIFDSAVLTTQYNNSPNMNNVKNDYSVWGERTLNSIKVPIHMRYAIDNPPVEYTDFNGNTWCATEKQLQLAAGVSNELQTWQRKYALNHVVDWRHLIYIMAQDWYNHNHDDDYDVLIRTNNHWPSLEVNLFPSGKTGYEQYYDDILGFWEELYNVQRIQHEFESIHSIESQPENDYEQSEDYFISGDYNYWNKMVIEDPTQLNFWFDFFKADEMGIGKFAVSVIGDRPKTINNSNIKVITYRDAPDVIYYNQSEYDYYDQLGAIKTGYGKVIFEDDDNEFYNSLDIVKRGLSAHQEIENMLYQYSFYNDTVNITNIPIYYLNPNTLISIKDELSNIIGYYIMTKINLSLAYNGTMQITATKLPERIY